MENDIFKTLGELQDQLAKATAETGATYSVSPSARSIFAPENLEREIKTFVPTDTPVRRLVPRTAGFGQAAAWDRLTSQLVVGDRGTGALPGTSVTGHGVTGAFADGGTPNETTQTYSQATAAYKNIGFDVTVGRQAIASSRNWRPMFEQRRRVMMMQTMLAEEWYILNGDSSVNANEFDGLGKSITTHSGSMALLTVSGINNQILVPYTVSGARFEYLVANPFQTQALANELEKSGSISRIMVNQTGVTSGRAVSRLVNSIDGSLIEIVTSRYAGATSYLLTINEPNGENGLEMQDLEPLSYYDVPFTGHGVTGRVFETTVLVDRFEVHQKKITGNAVS